MSLTINIFYTGVGQNAQKFVKEMETSGLADKIRAQVGNERYEYYLSLEDPQTVLLIDQWTGQAALDRHHASEMMDEIVKLRDKYELHMQVQNYVPTKAATKDEKFIRK
ncbi:antibiotic biosynthesis monooxygenase [Ligilactobacillus murinus]|uniref:putative quinol monooxygenase n=1 Tax=Ligilactobacillus murinus TaxID=1622 RepID=UPI00296B0812|nr:antibiotic biosynthesis monooxygenase [Ligilactobacillus murinus]WOY89097.1 antibiotic biosynthesis monooxygenase [Ligilactobacillus murinus]